MLDILVAVIAGIALLVSLLALRHNTASHRLGIQRELMAKATAINDAFLASGIKSPYALHFGIPDDRIRDFNAKAVLLLNQLSILNVAFEHRKVLGARQMRVYQKWASTYLRPWIEADEELKMICTVAAEGEDLRTEEFNTWLSKDVLPILQVHQRHREPEAHGRTQSSPADQTEDGVGVEHEEAR